MGRLIGTGRLIDANKLIEAMLVMQEQHGDVAESFMNPGGELSTEWWCVEDMVENAETVEAIPISYLTSRISRLRQHKTYAGDFGADLLEAIIKDYNKEKDNGKTE